MANAYSEIHMIIFDEKEDDVTVEATANGDRKTVVLKQGAARFVISASPAYLDALFSSMATAAYEAGKEESPA